MTPPEVKDLAARLRGEIAKAVVGQTETVDLMLQNRLTDAQREVPFMGIPFWGGQGFGLGLSVITDAEKQAWMGVGTNGAFGWPGAFGTWWQGDPANDLVMIYMIQHSIPLTPDAGAMIAGGRGMAGRLALPVFQRMTYDALGA